MRCRESKMPTFGTLFWPKPVEPKSIHSMYCMGQNCCSKYVIGYFNIQLDFGNGCRKDALELIFTLSKAHIPVERKYTSNTQMYIEGQ